MSRLTIFGWFIVLYLSCFPSFTHAQSYYVDSIKKVIKNAPHDTIRIRSTIDLSKELYNYFPDTVIPICQQVILEIDPLLVDAPPSVTKSLLSTKALALSNIGFMLMIRGQLTETFKYWDQSIIIREKIGDKKGLAAIYANMAFVYRNQGDYEKGISFYLKALKIEEEINNKRGIFRIQHNLGTLYMSLGALNKALVIFQKNLKGQLKEGFTRGVAHSYLSIGNVFTHPQYQDTSCSKSNAECLQQKSLNALEYFNKGLLYMEKSNQPAGSAEILSEIGDLYKNVGDPTVLDTVEPPHEEGYKIALKYYLESLEIYERLKQQEGMGKVLIKMNEIYYYQQDFDKALDALKKAKAVLAEIDYIDINENLYFWHYKNYIEQKRYKEALEMYQSYVNIKDTLSNKNVQQSILQAEIKYNYDKKVLADSLQLAQEKKVYTLQIQNQKTQNTYLVVVLILILTLVLFIWDRFRKSKQQNTIVEQANKDLARQHVLNQKIFSTISHDFRGPILSLQYILKALEKENKPEQINQYIQTLHQELDTSTGMLNNLLNWAKTEIGLKTVEKFSANVLQLALEAELELKQKLNEKELELRLHIPKDAVLQIPPDILRISLRNLLSNAIKFSYPKAYIDIHYNTQQTSLSIQDYGKGIDATKIKALFKQEVETDLGTFNEEGFGMGLYIVSELLYKYNFQISVQGEVNQGSIFVIHPNK